jgi:serine/threonine-protein kinase RsbW
MSHGGLGTPPAMATSSASRPPDLDAEIQRWSLEDPGQLQALRRSLLERIETRAGTDDALADVPEKMLIVATELATNALRHGLPPTIVRLCRTGRDYIIEVIDHDPTTEPGTPAGQTPAAGGLGLVVARALALDVGWYVTATDKHVWARFPFP